MIRHISRERIEHYRKRLMTSEELFATSSHLAACDLCYDRFGGPDLLEPTYDFIREELEAARDEAADHIDGQQVAAYVDGKLDWAEREIVESHFEVCSQCNLEADKLRLLRASTRTEHLHAASASRPRWAGLSQLMAWPIPVRVAGAAAAVLLLTWVVTLPLRARVTELQYQVEQLRHPDEPPGQPASAPQDGGTQLDLYRAQTEALKRENEAAQALIKRLEKGLGSLQGRAPVTGSFTPRPVATIADESGPIVLDEQGNITGTAPLPAPYRRLIKSALAGNQVKVSPLVVSLREKAGRLMGDTTGSASFDLLAPIYTAVETDRPTFRWRPLAGATGYTVTVLDSRLNHVATSPLLQTGEWKVSSPLKRGGVYIWQVKAIKGEAEVVSPPGPAPNVKFKVLEQTEVEELQRARGKYAGSHLLLALLYARAGLLDEAEREMQALAQLNPGSSIIRRWLGSINDLKD